MSPLLADALPEAIAMEPLRDLDFPPAIEYLDVQGKLTEAGKAAMTITVLMISVFMYFLTFINHSIAPFTQYFVMI